MRPPGGPPTRGTVPPTSTAVEENGGKQGLVEVLSSLRDLTVLLEPQSDHEASARREAPMRPLLRRTSAFFTRSAPKATVGAR